MAESRTSDILTRYKPFKSGNRWVVDGPYGRFHARTKRDAVAMLANGGSVDKQTCCHCGRGVNWAGAWSHDNRGAACRTNPDGSPAKATTFAQPHGATGSAKTTFRVPACSMQTGHVYRFLAAAGSAVADAGFDRVEVERVEADGVEVAVWGTWCGDGEVEQSLLGRFAPDEWVFDLTAAAHSPTR